MVEFQRLMFIGAIIVIWINIFLTSSRRSVLDSYFNISVLMCNLKLPLFVLLHAPLPSCDNAIHKVEKCISSASFRCRTLVISTLESNEEINEEWHKK